MARLREGMIEREPDQEKAWPIGGQVERRPLAPYMLD